MRLFLILSLVVLSAQAIPFLSNLFQNNQNDTKSLTNDQPKSGLVPNILSKINKYFGKKQRHGRGGGGSKPDDVEFQKFVDDMWAADEDRAPDGYIKLDWQEKLEKHSDKPLKPLFQFVNESLFERPIYKAQIDFYNKKLFVPSVCVEETAMNGSKLEAVKNFFNLLTGSKPFNIAYEFLKKNGHTDQSRDAFLTKLFKLWYGTYTRCNGPPGSSGFEHVFLGEKRQEIVDGHHNWVRYYLMQKQGLIKYYGYYVHDSDFIGTIRYKWDSNLKYKGGFFISTSPAFDFSIFSACVLTHSGRDCPFKVNNMPLAVKSFEQQCIGGGDCVSTTYPTIVE